MALMSFREPNQMRWGGVRPAHRGTQVAKSTSVANDVTIIYTVTADKILYLCTASLTVLNAVGTGNISVRNGADVVQYIVLRADFETFVGYAVPGAITFWPPLEIPSLWDIILTASGAVCAAAGFIFGWEE